MEWKELSHISNNLHHRTMIHKFIYPRFVEGLYISNDKSSLNFIQWKTFIFTMMHITLVHLLIVLIVLCFLVFKYPLGLIFNMQIILSFFTHCIPCLHVPLRLSQNLLVVFIDCSFIWCDSFWIIFFIIVSPINYHASHSFIII